MSYYLWKAYYEDDFDTFQRLLEAAVSNARPHTGRGVFAGSMIGSPGQLGSSPVVSGKTRKSLAGGTPFSGGHAVSVTKGDINARDSSGRTILHHAASSTADDAINFAAALVAHPLTDLYIQDYESAWTALHCAFYFGNVTTARLMLERDVEDALGRTTSHVTSTIGLIKVKDREGYGPLDLYAATIKDRTLRPKASGRTRSGSNDSDEDHTRGDGGESDPKVRIPFTNLDCDQLFTFGSNQNATLGFSNEDDRQIPERISLRRPEHLLRRFYVEHMEQHSRRWADHDPTHGAKIAPAQISEMWVEDIPWVIKARPFIIQDMHMAKLHSAVLTADPESNLYMCGHGQGGRLGTGDESTRYNFCCIDGGALAGKRMVAAALGLNHSIALSTEGEIFSWGSNAYGQLGYSLPKTTTSDEVPMSTSPKQIFGPLKREIVVGIATSRIHSVAHTGSGLFTFGKNEGQLGIVDSDARSLEIQITPRKVAASLFVSNIEAVSAIDKATVCLLENHDVWIFANYGYAKVQFPLEGFTNHFLQKSFRVTTYDHEPNRITKLTGGGDTVCALSSRGEIYTVSISHRLENPSNSSTTNPSKIRGAINQPQRIWSPRRTNMAARDVDVDVDGSIILSTEEGSVWKRTKRVKIKDATAAGTGNYKPKDYKFSRVPGLTRVIAVRASSHGAYAAARRDCDVTQTQITVDDQTLWQDMFQLLSLRQLVSGKPSTEDEDESQLRFWQGRRKDYDLHILKRFILQSKDIESELGTLEDAVLAESAAKFDAVVATTTSEVRVPVHRFILTGRSRVIRRGFRDLCETSTFTIQDLAVSEIDQNGRTVITFQGLDILTVIALVVYLYTDTLLDFWHFTRNAPKLAHRYRQVRTEIMKIATRLELRQLEPAARQMVQPKKSLHMDLAIALADPAFFYDGDFTIQLEDEQMRAHSALFRVRCPFFEGLFMGRAGGRWLSSRDTNQEVNVDLEHISSKTFKMVLQSIYSDKAEETFEDIVSVGTDDFLDAVMDVLSAANELLLDRLSQTCQAVIGRFVNVRNVCGLLNAISPSSVHEFKDAGLEYLCLNLEAMLQGHHLNELDEDLLLDLDNVVRENQLANMPFARSNRAELALHERHPWLAEAVDRDRRAKLDALSLRAKHADLASPAFSTHADEHSPLQQKARRKSSSYIKSDLHRPSLKGKGSAKDAVFAMDEDLGSDVHSPAGSPSIRAQSKANISDDIPSSLPDDVWYDSHGKILPSPRLGPQSSNIFGTTPRSPVIQAGTTPPQSSQPWLLTPLPGPRTDMKAIMDQAASNRVSNLSESLASSSAYSLASTGSASKLSQKERKRRQQAQLDAPSASSMRPVVDPETSPSIRPTSAWQTVPKPKAIPPIQPHDDGSKPQGTRSASTPQLTMRQTVANSKSINESSKPFIGPGSPIAVQRREASDSKLASPRSVGAARPPQQLSASSSGPAPHSIRHQSMPVEPLLGLSMSEIVAQEQMAKDVVKEAVAKRDLQDIQTEQEFEEWWTKESAKVQEAENRDTAGASKPPRARKHKSHRGRGGGRGGKPQSGQSSTT